MELEADSGSVMWKSGAGVEPSSRCWVSDSEVVDSLGSGVQVSETRKWTRQYFGVGLVSVSKDDGWYYRLGILPDRETRYSVGCSTVTVSPGIKLNRYRDLRLVPEVKLVIRQISL